MKRLIRPSTRMVVCPPGRLPPPDGVPHLLVASLMRSGTHLCIDLILNNFKTYRKRPLYIDLDAYLVRGMPLDKLKAAGGSILKTHYPQAHESAGHREDILDLARNAKVIVVHRNADDIRASMTAFGKGWGESQVSYLLTQVDSFGETWSEWPGALHIHFADLIHPERCAEVLAAIGRHLGLTPAASPVLPRPVAERKSVYADKVLTRLFGRHAPRINTTIGFAIRVRTAVPGSLLAKFPERLSTDSLIVASSMVFRRFYNSPVLTYWATNLLTPLKLLLLTPVLLRHLSSAESDAYYLLFALGFPFAVVEWRMVSSFGRAFALRCRGKSEARDEEPGDDETWPADKTVSAFWSLSFAVCVAAALVAYFLCITSLHKIPGFDGIQSECEVSSYLMLGAACISLMTSPVSALLFARARIAQMNRVDLFVNLAHIVASTLALLGGCGLITLWAISLACQPLKTGMLWFNLTKDERKLLVVRRLHAGGRQLAELWSIIWRQVLGQAGIDGGQRLSGYFLAGVVASGEVTQFLLAQSLIEAMKRFSSAPLVTKYPHLSHCFAIRGPLSCQRQIARLVLIYVVLFAVLAALAGGIMPEFFVLVKTKTAFIAASSWYLLAGMTVISLFAQRLCLIFEVANNPRYWRRELLSGILTAVAFLLASRDGDLDTFVLAATVPTLLVFLPNTPKSVAAFCGVTRPQLYEVYLKALKINLRWCQRVVRLFVKHLFHRGPFARWLSS